MAIPQKEFNMFDFLFLLKLVKSKIGKFVRPFFKPCLGTENFGKGLSESILDKDSLFLVRVASCVKFKRKVALMAFFFQVMHFKENHYFTIAYVNQVYRDLKGRSQGLLTQISN